MESKEIIAQSKNISLEGADDLKTEFCKLWGSIKTGLDLLKNIVKNPVVKGIIDVVISAGDAVAKEVCG